MKKLYVGNIPFKMTEDELKTLFSSFGNIEEAKVIMDRESGRSKGFAFVSFTEANDADAASTKLNGTEVGGRKIIVNEAREKPRGNFRPRS